MSGTTFAILCLGMGYFYLQTGLEGFAALSLVAGIAAVVIGIIDT